MKKVEALSRISDRILFSLNERATYLSKFSLSFSLAKASLKDFSASLDRKKASEDFASLMRAHFKKVGRYNHKITSLDKPQKLVYYNPGLE
jgi:hypothetical protein